MAYEAPRIRSAETYERLALACTGTTPTRDGPVVGDCPQQQKRGIAPGECEDGCMAGS